MVIPVEKNCNGCNTVKPAEAFNASRDKRGRPVLHSLCRKCRQDRRRCITPPSPMNAYLRDWAPNVEPGQPAWRVA